MYLIKTEGIGTIRSHLEHPAFEDDGGISSDDGDANSEEEEEEDSASPAVDVFLPSPPVTRHQRMPLPTKFDNPLHPHSRVQLKPPPPDLILPMSPSTPTPAALTKTPVPSRPSAPGFIPKIFPRRYASAPPDPRSHSAPTTPNLDSPTTFSPSTPTPTLASHLRSTTGSTVPSVAPTSAKRRHFKRKWATRQKTDYNFSASNDILGIVLLEIQGATDLPRLKNSLSFCLPFALVAAVSHGNGLV
jgi:phosphatidylserine decarboxylase